MRETRYFVRRLPILLHPGSPILVLALILAHPARGAIRTVQFAGMSGAETTTPVGVDSNFAFCEIMISNVGTQAQIIDKIDLMGYYVSTQSTYSAAPDQMALRTPAGASNNCIGVGNQIPPGGLCLIRFATETVPLDGRYALCAGTIQVEDPSSTQPGSIVASGAITQFQEAIAWTGSLSGGLYMSGSHLYLSGSYPPPNLAPDPNYDLSQIEFGDPAIHNMNFNCASACKQNAGMNEDQCVEHCGGGMSSEPGEWNYTSGFGYLTASDQWPNPTPSNSPAPGFFSVGTPSMIMHPPNPHYAAGLVIESITGPMNQICSGNAAFWVNGGSEFSHADSVDQHAIIAGAPLGGPAERLLCTHRHLKDDLYMRAGSSTTFAINAGMAF